MFYLFVLFVCLFVGWLVGCLFFLLVGWFAWLFVSLFPSQI